MELQRHVIGTTYKKENIYLGTVVENSELTYEVLKDRISQDPSNEIDSEILRQTLMAFVNNGVVNSEFYDVFYKDENGYTSFYVEGSETIKGDNSDGKGTIKNLVSIWDYYKEDEVYEAVLEDGSIAIAVEDMEPLYKYNSDYNLGDTPKQR